MLSFLASVLTLAHLVTSAPSSKTLRDLTPPLEFQILSISASGVLCPANSSVSYVLSEDKRTLEVSYNDYHDYIEPGMLRPLVVRDCELYIVYSMPKGYTFNIPTINYNAFYSLDYGVSVKHDTVYYFENYDVMNSTASGVVTGPVEPGMYHQKFDFRDLAFTSPCSPGVGEAYSQITSTMTITNNQSSDEGYGQVANEEHSQLTQVFDLAFQACQI